MPILPEKNDVVISSLFHWGQEFEVEGYTENKKVYIRVIGDADLNRARVMALRKSSELRRKLKDLDSDERIAYVADEGVIERHKLIEYISLVESRDFYKEVSSEVNVPFPKEISSDATLEQQERHQKEIDDYPNKLRVAISDQLNKKIDAFRAILETKTDKQLYDMYVERVVNELCETEMFSKFTEYSVASAIYTDPDYKIRLFGSFEEFENLPPTVKQQFIDYYRSLELSLDELKK